MKMLDLWCGVISQSIRGKPQRMTKYNYESFYSRLSLRQNLGAVHRTSRHEPYNAFGQFAINSRRDNRQKNCPTSFSFLWRFFFSNFIVHTNTHSILLWLVASGYPLCIDFHQYVFLTISTIFFSHTLLDSYLASIIVKDGKSIVLCFRFTVFFLSFLLRFPSNPSL